MNLLAAGLGSKSEALPARRSVQDRLFSSSVYTASLSSRTPKKLLFHPTDVIPGRGEKADNLFQGHFEFSGFGAHVSNSEPWFAADMPLHWHLELHKFSWIRDFAANDTDAAKRHIRALLISWIRHFGAYKPYVWDRPVLARRLINWIRQSAFLMTSNDGDFNYQFLKSLRLQFHHLKNLRKMAGKSEDLLQTDLALYLCASIFKDTKGQKSKMLERLLLSTDQSILADGCHISRNPSMHYEVLADLVGLKHDFTNNQEEVPGILMGAVDRLAPIVRFFQHGDGSLALFNGADLMEEGDCDHLLAISDAAGRAPHRCPLGGFERLKAGRSLLLIETGQGGRAPAQQLHCGIGGFEFSYGQERLIVNCGSHPDKNSHWGKALASTAAHSTLCIEDKNAVFPSPVKSGEEDPVSVASHEEGGNLWLDMVNPGYQKSLGIFHNRRLFLESSGVSLRGEDTVRVSKKTEDPTRFDLRFHLHPDLSVSKSMGGNKLLIRTQNGAGWQFISSLAEMSLEESVYCAKAGDLRKNQQIVLSGVVHGQEELTIKWAFRLMGDGEEKPSA